MQKRKIQNIKKQSLIKYGFILKGDTYYYEKSLTNNKFTLKIKIRDELESRIIDNNTNEEYILVDIESASGNYVGKIKEEYQTIIDNIISTCTRKVLFEEKKTNDLIKYIKQNYKSTPEFLWKKFPKCAAIRNNKNKKWFCLFNCINEEKLKLKTKNDIEIINVRYQKGKCNEIIDNTNIFPAYHMNKDSWITIIINNLDINIIYSLIDNSYDLSLK